jgi:hypothetical protein
VSDTAYEWGGDYLCQPDLIQLYKDEPERADTIGYPIELDETPRPKTFCVRCLLWFDDPKHDHNERTTHGQADSAAGDADPGPVPS